MCIFNYGKAATGEGPTGAKTEGVSISGRVHYGFLLAHHPRIEHLVKHTFGFEISLSRKTDGKEEWEQYYRYPSCGITYVFLDFNQAEIIGNAHALMPFISLPLCEGSLFHLTLRLAGGAGYLTKKFDRVENYKNDVIGSHLNAAVQVNVELQCQLTSQCSFQLNTGLTHFSNGSFRTPNLGINNPSVSGGFSCQLSESPDKKVSQHLPSDKKWQADILYAFGIKELYPPTGKKYCAHTLSLAGIKPLGHKSRLAFGADLFYDLGLIQNFRTEGIVVSNAGKIIRGGLYAGHELVLNKLCILVQAGTYIIDSYGEDGRFYHRIGFKYLAGKHLFLNLTLKTHYAKADYAEWGLGWKFYRSKKS